MSGINDKNRKVNLIRFISFLEGVDETLAPERLAEIGLLKKVAGGFKPGAGTVKYEFVDDSMLLHLRSDGMQVVYDQYRKGQLPMLSSWSERFTSREELRAKIQSFFRGRGEQFLSKGKYELSRI
ncbi:hypothetical protein AB4302_08380 [Vibrio breoganii]